MVLTNQDLSLDEHNSEEDVEQGIQAVGEDEEELRQPSIMTEDQEQEEADKGKHNSSVSSHKLDDAQSTCSNSSSSHMSDSPFASSSTSSSSSSSPSTPEPAHTVSIPSSSSSTSSNDLECGMDTKKDTFSSAIQLEDNNKNFTVQESSKSRSWLESFNSLAPRTRQTLRTAAIALVSALALVAIFHLAKLAEHPVNTNAIDDPAKQLGPVEVEEVDNGTFFKSKNGKVHRQPESGGNNGGDGEVPQQYSGPLLSSDAQRPLAPVQDMLARAGHNVKIHPILGIPVVSDFVDIDIKRINRLDRSRHRPANATDIQKTLSLVRRQVESDRKQLNNKELRLWTPGDAPLRVLLVTTWRSGSTFLGQVLASHPAVYSHYEPLSTRGIRQVRSGRDAFQAQQLLHRLLDCRYSGQDEYLNYLREHADDMLGHNKPIWDSCKRGPNTNACYNATFLSEACQMFPIQLVKTVRLRLNLTQLFLNDEKMNVKVVFLVRDPRATMSSRYSSVSWCTDKPDCSSPEVLCSDLQGDLKVATALKHLYPNRFTMVKYEDIATASHEAIHQLMDFLGMEYSPNVARFVEEHTNKDQDQPWSTKRKSADRVSMWKKQLPLEEVHAIQNACEPVMKNLGYEPVGQ